jgi:hypothetical protein
MNLVAVRKPRDFELDEYRELVSLTTEELLIVLEKSLRPLRTAEIQVEILHFIQYSLARSQYKYLGTKSGNSSLFLNMYLYRTRNKLCKGIQSIQEIMNSHELNQLQEMLLISDFLQETYAFKRFPLREPGLLSALVILRLRILDLCVL